MMVQISSDQPERKSASACGGSDNKQTLVDVFTAVIICDVINNLKAALY